MNLYMIIAICNIAALICMCIYMITQNKIIKNLEQQKKYTEEFVHMFIRENINKIGCGSKYVNRKTENKVFNKIIDLLNKEYVK